MCRIKIKLNSYHTKNFNFRPVKKELKNFIFQIDKILFGIH